MFISEWLETQDRWYAPPGVTIYNKAYDESRKNKMIIGAVVTLIAIGVGVGLYFALSPKKTSENYEAFPLEKNLTELAFLSEKKQVRFNISS